MFGVRVRLERGAEWARRMWKGGGGGAIRGVVVDKSKWSTLVEVVSGGLVGGCSSRLENFFYAML